MGGNYNNQRRKTRIEERNFSMDLLNRLERKLGKYAIPNLMYYVVILYAIGMVVQMFAPSFYVQYLMLDARAILHGQIWRIVTFMIWPPSSSLFFNLLAIYLYYSLGTTLERVWGTFRFNVYFFMGILGHVLAALLIYLLTGNVYVLTTDYLNFSLFFAFAATFPDMEFYLFFVIPIKAKWLAVFDGAYFLYGFLFGGMANRIAIAMSLLNFVVYFLMSRGSKYNPKEIRRKQKFRSQMREAAQTVKSGTRHRCAVCGRTEADDPNLVFRYCSKCEGDYEYCQDHLYTHQHVIRGGMDPRQGGNGPVQGNGYRQGDNGPAHPGQR